MIIEIKEKLAEITYPQNGANIKKTISFETLVDMFQQAPTITTPLLPMGTRYFAKFNQNKYLICLETPPQKRQFEYANHNGKKIVNDLMPLPRMLFFLVFAEKNNKYIFETAYSRVAALRDPLMSDSDTLYLCPLPNSYNDLRVCWGSTMRNNKEFESIDNFCQSYRFIDLYFSSKFNTDLSIHYMPENGQRAEDMYRAVIKADKFDGKYLRSSGQTFSSVISRITKLQ